MIISRTPFRISFFGGGTDYPVWFREHGGSVISTAIDKYCYISCRNLPPFFEYKHRIVYSKIEHAAKINDITHPSVRECLRFSNPDSGVEIHHDADLPARSGLGSSSSFTVGLLNVLNAYQGKITSRRKLFEDAIYVEQKMIGEAVGSQDQVIAAVGGFNRIDFQQNGGVDVTPLTVDYEVREALQSNIMLFFTGLTRTASNIAKKQIGLTPERQQELRELHSMVDEAIKILSSGSKGIQDFGRLLHESWQIKRSIHKQVSNSIVDDIYNTALKAGAVGGKLLGAGGGGFMIIFADPEHQAEVRKKLSRFMLVPVKFSDQGSQIIFYQ